MHTEEYFQHFYQDINSERRENIKVDVPDMNNIWNEMNRCGKEALLNIRMLNESDEKSLRNERNREW